MHHEPSGTDGLPAAAWLDITPRFENRGRLTVLRLDDDLRSRDDRRPKGRSLLALAASIFSGVDARDVSVTALCARCGGDHGRPVLSVPGRTSPLGGSISHAAGSSIAAVADRAVGVDAESLSGHGERFHAIRSVLGPWASEVDDGEQALQAWTSVEAVVKADGRGLEIDPQRVHVDGWASPPGARASVDGTAPFYTLSSAVVDGLVVTVATAE